MIQALFLLGISACAAFTGRVSHCGDPDSADRTVPPAKPAQRATVGLINGYELLVFTGGPETNGGACEVKSGRFVTGTVGFLDASAGLTDPTQLATLAMTLLERGVAGHSPWTGDPSDGPPAALSPAPPAVQDGVLRYWRRHQQLDAWVFVTVKLANGELSVVDQMSLLDAGTDPMARIRAGLADPDAMNRTGWLGKLVELGTPEAMALCAEVLRNDPSPMVRKEAVSRLGNLKPPGAAPLLAERLAQDSSPEVRGLAATMLGRVGGPEARSALQSAATGDSDPGVRAAAEGALARLAQP